MPAESAKPAAQSLGIDMTGLTWQAAAGPEGSAPGAIEVAMAPRDGGGTWVLVRVAGDPDDRVLVYDEHEWECFLDGVRHGEFDLPGERG
jgi:hypothetical protein